MGGANDKKMFELLLDEIADTLEGIEQRCLKLEASTDQVKEMQIIFRAAHNVKGASQLYGLTEFGVFVHKFEDVLTIIQKSERKVANGSIDVLLAAQEFLKNWVEKLRDDTKFIPDTAAISQRLLAHIEDVKNNLVVDSAPAPVPAAAPTAAPVEAGAATTEAPPAETTLAHVEEVAAPGKHKKRASGTLRIPSQKIDEVMQLIGELSIHGGILLHNLQHGTFTSEASRNAVQLNQKTLKDLYELALTLRMQSAESLFSRMERISRDIAREQNKKVTVRLKGADTPLDKNVVELITDPMVHLVRNAIDHGIEDVDTRARLGKPVAATLTIKVHQDTGHVVISISDDGRGMDPAVLLEKAVKRGLVPAGKRMSDSEIIKLIFLPGFSTRDVVTEISGRGVGMDIVQKAIQNLGGNIDIQTKKGFGTTFLITLPASLEIIDGLMVRVSNQLYVVPRQEIAELIDLKSLKVNGDSPQRGRVIQLRDSIVPLENLSDYIGLKVQGAKAPATRGVALVIHLPNDGKLALRVDSVMSQQQIVVRPISDNLVNLPGFTGLTILGNGEPTMIVSTAAIAASYMKWIHPRGDVPSSDSGTQQHGESA